MREIKFRAWVPADHWINKSGKGECIYDWQDKTYVDSCGFNPCEDGIVIEQFIGLRDKNGCEIYEGDIVQTFMFGKKVVGIIKYSGKWGSFYFGTKNDYGVGIAFKDVFDWCYDDEDDEGEILSEIIGNIHENPELLP